jgi:hypothetical protein
MLKRVRQFFDSMVFAGLKPDAHRERAKRTRWLGPLHRLVDRIPSRPAPSDPLYLSNRTFDQKVKLWLAIAVPCLILAGLTVLGLSRFYHANGPGPAPEPSAATTAAKLLPDLDKTIRPDVIADAQVLEAHVESEGGMKVAGMVKNNTSRLIRTTEIVLNLADATGSNLGAVRAQVDNLAPNATVKFQIPIEQKDATIALVREVTTQ